MGILSNLLGGGPQNSFKAKAPVNTFNATGANVAPADYTGSIGQAEQAAQPNAGAGTAAQQTSLAQLLTAQANGQGPSLVQDQLRQATEQNNQQSAGAIASQRSLNPAQAARMILDANSRNNQQAAGQSAVDRMQEEMQARGLLAQELAAQRGQDIGQQGANTQTLGTLGGLQQGQNALSVEDSLGVQGMNQRTAAENATNNLQAQQINADIAKQNAASSGNAIGGLLNAAGAIGGGIIGGPIGSMIGSKLSGLIGGGSGSGGDGSQFTGGGSPSSDNLGGSDYSIPSLGLAGGGKVPGRALRPGNNSTNDTVRADLSPGEIVLPRSVTQSPNAADKARAFVAAIQGNKETEATGGYARVLAKQRQLEQRLKALEGMLARKAS